MGLFNGLGQVITEHLERRTKQNELFYPIKEKIKKKRKVSTINKEVIENKGDFCLVCLSLHSESKSREVGIQWWCCKLFANNVSKFNFVFNTKAFIIVIKNYITSIIELALY